MPRSEDFLTAAACLPMGSLSPDGSTAGSVRLIRGDGKSSDSAGPASGSTPTSEQLTLGLSDQPSSPVASPARAARRQASATALSTPRPFCGARWPEPFANFDPDTSSSRMWRTCSPSLMEQSGMRFSGTWPRAGTTRSGTAYRQQPSAPRTSVTGSSPLLPTPRASERENRQDKRTPSQIAGTHGRSLLAEIATLLPTPMATVYGHNQSPSPGAAIRPSLDGLLRMLPSPVSGDAKGSRQSTATNPRSPHDTLSDLEYRWSGAYTDPQSAAGKRWSAERPSLSALFEEWMLGLPLGWSDPACVLSATEFRSSSASSPANTSSDSSGSV